MTRKELASKGGLLGSVDMPPDVSPVSTQRDMTHSGDDAAVDEQQSWMCVLLLSGREVLNHLDTCSWNSDGKTIDALARAAMPFCKCGKTTDKSVSIAADPDRSSARYVIVVVYQCSALNEYNAIHARLMYALI